MRRTAIATRPPKAHPRLRFASNRPLETRRRDAAMRRTDGRTFHAYARGNSADPAVHRRLGCVRRKPGASRRRLAYSCSGAFLSHHGYSLDYPVETAAQVDPDRLVSGRFARARLKHLY